MRSWWAGPRDGFVAARTAPELLPPCQHASTAASWCGRQPVSHRSTGVARLRPPQGPAAALPGPGAPSGAPACACACACVIACARHVHVHVHWQFTCARTSLLRYIDDCSDFESSSHWMLRPSPSMTTAHTCWMAPAAARVLRVGERQPGPGRRPVRVASGLAACDGSNMEGQPPGRRADAARRAHAHSLPTCLGPGLIACSTAVRPLTLSSVSDSSCCRPWSLACMRSPARAAMRLCHDRARGSRAAQAMRGPPSSTPCGQQSWNGCLKVEAND